MKTNTPALHPTVKAFSNFFQNLKSQTRNAATTSIVILASFAAHAQTTLGPYDEQPRSANPLREPFAFAYRHTPIAFDWDKDGDYDVMVADFDGGNGFHYLKNEGTATHPSFTKIRGIGNPFQFTAYDDGATPAFSDIDKDGDLDMFLGIIDGTFRYYKNSNTGAVPFGTAQAGAWNASTKTGNPFFGIDLGDYASPYFIDLDNDNDDDLVIGTSYAPFSKTIYYYINDGNGNFVQSTLTGINPVADAVTPIFIDINEDGNLDILTGEASGIIRYFKRTGATSFEEQTGTANPFNGIDKGEHSSPTAADFDNDGDLDLIVGAELSTVDLSYYENKGNGVFEEKLNFDNPFNGFDAGSSASPYFTDVDDDGDQDMLVGNNKGSASQIIYMQNDNGVFIDKTSSSIFAGVVTPYAFTPSFIDIDGDGDKDLLGGVDNSTGVSVIYFKNESGVLALQNFATGPFKNISIMDQAKTDFVDIDNDGDYDLFLSDYTGDFYEQNHLVRYFKNTGTVTAPVFTELTGTENPLSQVTEQFQIFPRFTDIDNDGDFDAILGEGGDVIEGADGNEFSFYENTGIAASPVFTYRDDLIQQGTNPYFPSPTFIDFDQDGDKDIFIGEAAGYISYYKNNNAAATASINANPLNVSSTSTFIDEALTIADSDNDLIVEAVVTITNYSGEETLTFTPAAGIAGSFNAGVLHFKGVASAAAYQTLLRSVKIEYSGDFSAGRKRSPKNATVTRTISIRVSDIDGTTSAASSRAINFVSNEAPVFNNQAVNINVGGSVNIDLKPLATDVNNNLNLTSFSVVTQPVSGAAAAIDANGNLSVNYSNIIFAGTEAVTVQVSDTDGASDQSVITITVVNSAPVITPVPVTTPYGSTKIINLADITSDPDGNLVLTSIEVVGTTLSGATASIEMISATEVNLTLDYSGITFSGTDEITVRACDQIGSCTESVISVVVDERGEIEIYNAVAPNSSGDNKFFRILNIPGENKVSIFNRWGDSVFETRNYDNNISEKRFEGFGKNGNALPSGTYFYKIEYTTTQESKTLTGYLALKQ